ncbi:MAG: hypothetical protein HRT57_07060 [Crocinitomicaceae bacterium]|nr:hypothetical protein [Crocinitomicaceae bacterium]
MKIYLDKLEYPKMSVDSNSIDMFWLQGPSRINQFQQIKFLGQFYQKKLPISEKTYKKVREILIISEEDGEIISGKTGLSITDGIDNGWYIGYVEKDDDIYFYATNVDEKSDIEFKTFLELRRSITHNAFIELKILD